MNINIKKMASLLLAGAVILSATGCNLTGNNTKIPEDAVVVVNGDVSTVADYSKAFAMVEKSYNELYGDSIWTQEIQGKTVKAMVQEQILDSLITEKLIIGDVKKTSFKISDSEVQESYDKFMEALKKNEKDIQYFTEKGIDELYLKAQIKAQLYQEEFKNVIKTEVEKDSKQLAEYEKTYPIQVSASHILVTEEAKAKELYEKIKAGGDFATLAKENSIDTGSAKNGGSLGLFPRGMMVAEFEKAAFDLKVGEVSEIVHSKFGYHIIKMDKILTLEEIVTSGAKPEEVEVYKQTIVSNISKEVFDLKIEALKKDSKIDTFPDRIK